MENEFEKAARGERARIEALIARQEARVRRAFRRFLDDVRSNAVRRQVRIALESGGVNAALRVVNAHVVRLGTALTQVFQEAGAAEAEALTRQLKGDRAGLIVTFDPTDPRAVELMRRNSMEFIVDFTRAQARATRAALQTSLLQGAGTVATARAFRESIGLTEFQVQAVANYRRMLERGDYNAALNADIRDRRSDRLLARLADEERLLADREPLGAKRIQTMTERYRTRYLQYRAETIARTETHSVVNQARDQALTQALRQADLPQTSVQRTWRATMDMRTRDTHAMLDGQVQPQGQPFISVSGARMLYPGDRSLGAPAEEIINCRCVLTNKVLL